jgi:hypothetical protein
MKAVLNFILNINELDWIFESKIEFNLYKLTNKNNDDEYKISVNFKQYDDTEE